MLNGKLMQLMVNGKSYELSEKPGEMLSDLLRYRLGLTGTKIGCNESECGACTVLVDGSAVLSCSYPAAKAQGKQVTTIEAMDSNRIGQALQAAWIRNDVPQCGYCQSGQIMTAAALLKENPHPSDAEIDSAMASNLCRCATYLRIRAGIHRAAEIAAQKKGAA